MYRNHGHLCPCDKCRLTQANRRIQLMLIELSRVTKLLEIEQKRNAKRLSLRQLIGV